MSAIVSVRDLQRHYTQGAFTVKALQGVDFEIQTGEFTALMGPSGSGKSTLLQIIGGLDAPTSGVAVIDFAIDDRPGKCPGRTIVSRTNQFDSTKRADMCFAAA